MCKFKTNSKKNVKTNSGLTCCIPGATVRDIAYKAIEILANEPDIKKVIVHVGTNDIRMKQSEVLKDDFKYLFCSLKQSVNHVFVSGPIPSCRRCVERFSRLLSLHTWLSSACVSHGVSYIDNFNLFCECRQLFRGDGIHPNWAGAKLLSANILFSVLNSAPLNSAAPLTCVQSSPITSPNQSHRY